MTLDEFINSLKSEYEIVAGFPKEDQLIYPPDDRKETPWEMKQKNPVFRRSQGGQTVAQVAQWNEFGTKKTPSRPFLREALRKNKSEIINLVKEATSFRNLSNPNRFDLVGKHLQQMIRDSILNGNWTPNAPITKYKKLTYASRVAFSKGKDVSAELAQTKPLIDRGIMLRAVNYEVRKK